MSCGKHSVISNPMNGMLPSLCMWAIDKYSINERKKIANCYYEEKYMMDFTK